MHHPSRRKAVGELWKLKFIGTTAIKRLWDGWSGLIPEHLDMPELHKTRTSQSKYQINRQNRILTHFLPPNRRKKGKKRGETGKWR